MNRAQLLRQLESYEPNTRDPLAELELRLARRDWAGYFRLLAAAEREGHRRTCAACLVRGDGLARINWHVARFHLRIHTAAFLALGSLVLALLRPAALRVLGAAIKQP